MDSSPLLPDLPPQEPPHEYLHLPKNVVENIFTSLSPRDLALASGVASSWRATASLAPWDTFYSHRWHITPLDSSRAAYTSWHSLFSSRMTLARSFKGRPQLDRLSGHTSGVKVCKILSETNLLLTGSVDRRLALWDLETGTRLASSLQHAGTVRSLAIDNELLVTGSSDHRIRVWRPRKYISTEEEQQQQQLEVQQNEAQPHDFYLAHQQQQQQQLLTQQQPRIAVANTTMHMTDIERRRREFAFQIEGARTVLAGGHTGPVTALELAPTALFSGSWDYCVRVWDRNNRNVEEEDEDEAGGGGGVNMNNIDNNASLQCIQVLHFDDMVTDMAFKREKLFVAAGSEAHIVDAGDGGGGGLRRLSSFHRHASNSIVTAVEASEDERFLFYSTAEGGIYACDVRDPRHHHHYNSNSTSSRLNNDPGFSCSSAVTGLSWDFPWLAASLQNGEILLLNAENTLLGGYAGNSCSSSSTSSSIRNISPIGGGGVGSRGAGGSGLGSNINRGQQQQHRQGQSSTSTPRWFSRALTAGVPGGAQCVDISGKWLVAGYESGCIVSWDFSRAVEAERAAEALRAGRKKKREKRRQNAKDQKKQGHRYGAEDKTSVPRSSAMPISSYPIPLTTKTTITTSTTTSSSSSHEEIEEEGSDLQFLNTISRSLPERLNNNATTRTTVPSLRAPAPISLSRSPGRADGGDHNDGGEGQRGRENWHILRMAGSNSNPDVL
ncbi:hypothetical protein Ndes2526B_g00623 [Nannochloris sp. 'desiccata']|nr:putative F-box/WD-40 repeat-containing protein [Chlorella desiccata (nom. nud.)]